MSPPDQSQGEAFPDPTSAAARAPSELPWLIERLRSFGGRPAVSREDHTASYADLFRATEEAFTDLHQRGIPPGASVALLADYSLEGLAAFLALFRHRCCIVPISPACTDAEAADRVRIAGVSAILNLASHRTSPAVPAPQAQPASSVPRSPASAALVLFSSGSTGTPKAMQHDLSALVDSYRSRKPRSLAFLSFLLFDHIGGLNTLLNALASGSHLVVPVSRDPHEVAALIARHRVRILPTSPTFLNLFLLSGAADSADLSSLRIITYGTEPMPESLLHRLHRAFPRIKLLQTFGTSETGILRTTSRASDSLEIRLDDPNFEYKIVGGELWLRSRTQVRGYLNAASERFTPDGWFQTGDQVEESDDGFIRILGRASEVINVGGEKVMPAEVESVLAEHPSVRDCRVFAKAHPLTGQVVAAEVVPAPESTPGPQLARALKTHLRARLAPYKVPVYVSFTNQIETQHGFKKRRQCDG